MNEETWLRQPRWVATISDGRTLDYGDIGWLDLKYYVENGFPIVSLDLVFRNEFKRGILPENAEGYFFCKGIGADLGESPINYFLVGYLKEDKIYIQKWVVPELVKVQEEVRPKNSCLNCLIINRTADETKLVHS